MRHLAARCIVAAVCTLAVVIAEGQEASPIPPGDAAIAGRVIDRDSERSLGQVMMTLTSPDGTRVLKTLTDANGQYVFEAIAWGSYRLSAFLDGYGTQMYGEADMRPGREELVRVAQAQVTRIDFALRRAGVITGIVTNAGGEAIKDAMVVAALMLDDRSLVITQTTARTNDRRVHHCQRSARHVSHLGDVDRPGTPEGAGRPGLPPDAVSRHRQSG